MYRMNRWVKKNATELLPALISYYLWDSASCELIVRLVLNCGFRQRPENTLVFRLI